MRSRNSQHTNVVSELAFHFVHYNFMRIHSLLRITPAMGIINKIWDWKEILKYEVY
jgi:hypothetical protein